MTFPAAPTNGDTTTVNGISYVYDSSVRSWTRTTSPLGNITVANNATIANIFGNVGSFTGNVTVSAIQTNIGIYWAGNGAPLSSNPGGNTGQLQYNNNNAFAGANIIFNNTNGNLTITSNTNSTSTTTGALIVAGGAGIAGNVYAGALYDNGSRTATTGKAIAMSIVFGG